MAIFKVTGVPDFTQLKSEISKLQSKPIRIQVETQPSKLGIGVAQREINQLGTSAEKQAVAFPTCSQSWQPSVRSMQPCELSVKRWIP